MGKKSSKTTSTSTPYAPFIPAMQSGLNTINSTVTGNQPALDAQAGQARGYATQLGQQAFGQQPGLGAAFDYTQKVLNGGYLNGNPYIDDMAALASQNAANNVNSTFSLAGRTGSGNHATDLARGVAQADLGVRNQDYLAERGNQQQAAGMLPSLISSQYSGVLPYSQLSQTAGQLPYYGINNLGQIGSIAGGYGTQTGTQPGGWGNDILNAAASIGSAAILASDRRLKADIEELGDWDSRGDGLKRYAFRYKWERPGTRHEGVMADEVARLRPQAYAKGYLNGEYDGVNYALLGVA